MDNQEKVGKLIADLRKEQCLTQKQLADKIHVSDKTVSKWESGNGLPDTGLLDKLCGVLGITVSELLSGERLSVDDSAGKSEENGIEDNSINGESGKNKKRRADGFPLVAGYGALVVFLVIGLLSYCKNLASYIDIPSFFLVVGIVFCLLAATGRVKLFFRGFAVVCSGKRADAAGKPELAKMRDTFRFTFHALFLSGMFCTTAGVLTSLGKAKDAALSASLSVSLIPLFYALLLMVLLLPFCVRLADAENEKE